VLTHPLVLVSRQLVDFLLEHKQGSGEGYREMILGMGFVHLPHDDTAQPLRHLLEEGE
jgi:hypothetical protein